MMLLRVANGLTIGRLVSVPLVVLLLFMGRDDPGYLRWVLVLVVVLQASDILDGFLARRALRSLKVRNPLGERLDPLADKLYINCTYLGLSLLYGFPWPVTLVILLRDVSIIGGWHVRKWLFGIETVRPNVWGKLADSLQAFLIIGFLFDMQAAWIGWGELVVVSVTLLSGFVYAWTWREEGPTVDQPAG
jgi:cardiolipin synthase